MANIKSAKKRVLVGAANAERNKAIRTEIKTEIKKVDAAIAAGDKEAAKACLSSMTKKMDMATSKGIFHKNTTSRKISRMSQAVAKMQ